jgi:hypothetical protein
MIPLPRDFQDFLRLLNANAVRYLVIGGYAVAYHGNKRASGRQKDLADAEALTAKTAKTGRPR